MSSRLSCWFGGCTGSSTQLVFWCAWLSQNFEVYHYYTLLVNHMYI
jgi:hypothetical protein